MTEQKSCLIFCQMIRQRAQSHTRSSRPWLARPHKAANTLHLYVLQYSNRNSTLHNAMGTVYNYQLLAFFSNYTGQKLYPSWSLWWSENWDFFRMLFVYFPHNLQFVLTMLTPFTGLRYQLLFAHFFSPFKPGGIIFYLHFSHCELS